MSRKEWNGQMPAFDTITSTLPNASTAFAHELGRGLGSATSPFTASPRWPSRLDLGDAASAASSSRL
jgi:hypothetical protein